MDNCIICLEVNCDISSRITTLSSEWISGNIQQIIEKHLWWWYLKPLSSSSNDVRWICRQCWWEISTFHKFYCKVEMIHKHYQPILNSLAQSDYGHKQDTTVIKYEIDDTLINTSTHSELPPETHSGIEDKLQQNAEIDRNGIKQEVSFIISDIVIKEENEYIDNEASNTAGMQTIKDITYEHSFNTSELNIKEEDTANDNTIIDSESKIRFDEIDIQNSKDRTDSYARKSIEDKTSVQNNNDEQNVLIKNKTETFKNSNFFKESQHKLICNICSETLVDFRTLRIHFRNEHNMRGYAMCCGKKYFQRYLFLDHVKLHKDPNLFKCTLCAKTYDTRNGLEMHIKSHNKRERNYNCDECGKSFLELRFLECHKLKHLPESERNFNCSQCDKKFASDYLRRQHENSIHVRKYARICDICGKTFSRRYTFESHMKEHAGVPPSFETCDICGAKLSNKSNLKQHMKMQHLEKDLHKEICPYCSKVSPNLSAHRTHINNVHKMERKHACNLCNKAFARALLLKEHMGVHTGEALYQCSYCSRTFMSRANMYKHQKNMHPQEWQERHLKKFSESRKKSEAIDNGIETTLNK